MKAIIDSGSYDLTIKFYTGSYSTALKFEDDRISVCFGAGSAYHEQHERVVTINLLQWDVRVVANNDLYDKLKAIDAKEYFNVVFQYLMAAENWMDIIAAMLAKSYSKGFVTGQRDKIDQIKECLDI